MRGLGHVLSSCTRKASMQEWNQEGFGETEGRGSQPSGWRLRKQARGCSETSGGSFTKERGKLSRGARGLLVSALLRCVCEMLTRHRRGGWLGGAWCLRPQVPVLNTGTRLIRLEPQLGLYLRDPTAPPPARTQPGGRSGRAPEEGTPGTIRWGRLGRAPEGRDGVSSEARGSFVLLERGWGERGGREA